MEETKSLRVEVITKETIKPSSPSPKLDHQRTFKLSLLDQFSTHNYIPTLFFYKTSTCSNPGAPSMGEHQIHERSLRLKSSLSETLTRFYPFAGRLKDPLTISCNDEGVGYSVAKVINCSLFDVLEEPNEKQLKILFPDDGEFQDITTRPLLLIQVSFFECGGFSLGLKLSHKVADAVTTCSFINGWADSALGNVNLVTPDFSASTLFPPLYSLPPLPQILPPNHNKSSVRSCRFVFGPSELASLQAKATSLDNPRPSRFEAVSAFIFKTMMISENELRPKSKKPSVLIWLVNLRSKLQPPLPQNCIGNLVGTAVHEVGLDENDMSTLAGYLRRGTIDICQDFVHALKGGDSAPGILELQMLQRNAVVKMFAESINGYLVTSRCKLPFYEADFGWGKPLWVTKGTSNRIPHMVGLMDTRDGNGIEVKVSLTEEEIPHFESNQELKKYAAFNPSAFS